MGRRTIAILVFIVSILILVVVAVLLVRQPEEAPPALEAPAVEGGAAGEQVEPPLEGTAAFEQVAPEAAVTLPPTMEVVVSLQTVPRGWLFTEAELESLVTTDLRLTSEVDPNNVFTKVEDVIGLYARSDIFQGETLTKDALISDPTLIGIEDFGPSSLIPPGTIAAAVPMDRLSGVAYSLKDGDFVDILITFLFYQIDEEFQTYLRNAGIFFLEEAVAAAESQGSTDGSQTTTDQTTVPSVFVIAPFGRFEDLPSGDVAHVGPSEFQRPVPVAMVIQNAKVIQVGGWEPPSAVQQPTPTVIAAPLEGETPAEGATPAAGGPEAQVTPTPNRPDVLLLALAPQQQLLLKYALESQADIDFALRSANDGQLYTIENVDLNFILNRFNIEVPTNFSYSVDGPDSGASSSTGAPATPESPGGTTSGGG
ncbi:MAG: hypothetical protein ACE5E7_01450 [Anaerolineae bacterium]